MHRLIVIAAALLTAACTPKIPIRGLPASPPPRPALPAEADTNSAAAYTQQGLLLLQTDPSLAVDAFYWATRLDPESAPALYGLRTALQAVNIDTAWRTLVDKASDTSSAIRQLDSLMAEALARDPFLHTRFEHQLMQLVMNKVRQPGPLWFPARLRAQRAFENGHFEIALELFDEAAEADTSDFTVHGDRARAHFMMGRFDSALVDMQRLLDGWRQFEEKTLLPIYMSKALVEYGIAVIHLNRKDLEAAKAALGRALVEDLSFARAHALLGDVLIALGDTIGALHEHATAVELAPHDAGLRHRYGSVLLFTSRFAEAADQFRRALEIEPFYAPPHLPLATMLDQSGFTEEAIAHYRAYLAGAPRSFERQREIAEQQLAALERQTADVRQPEP